MQLSELETLLAITVADEQKPTYEARLKSALDHINSECGEKFTTKDAAGNVTVTLPEGVKMGAALLVRSMSENPSVSSQSLGDMSKSFFEGAAYKAAQNYWATHAKKKVRFV